MGDQMRYSPHGPRELTDADIREDDKPKVVLNPEIEWTKAAAKFAPLVDPERLTMLLQKLGRQLRMLAAQDHNAGNLDRLIEQNRSEASRVEQELSVVQRNLARAGSNAQFAAISAEFEQLSQRVAKLQEETTRGSYSIEKSFTRRDQFA